MWNRIERTHGYDIWEGRASDGRRCYDITRPREDGTPTEPTEPLVYDLRTAREAALAYKRSGDWPQEAE